MNKSSTPTKRSETKGLAQPGAKASAKSVARVAVKQLQKAKAPAPPKGQLTKTISRAATQSIQSKSNVEWRTEHHGVPVIGGEGIREGHCETRAMGEDLHVRGTERLGPVGINGVALKAGDVMNVIELNPASFGVRIVLLSLPYAKFEFTRVRLRYVGLISEANAAANGGLFIGYNADPSSPIPVGNNGLDAMSTWGRNVAVVPVFNSTSDLDLDLQARKSTEPLFVDTNGDVRFSTQGQMMILAGQDFPAESQNFGQWFIEYEVRLYEINQPSAMMNCLTAAGSVVIPGGNYLIPLPGSEQTSGLLYWTGDTSLTTSIAYGTFGGNLQLTRKGLYLFEIRTYCGSGAMPFVATASVDCISKCFYPTNAGGGSTAHTPWSNGAGLTSTGSPANVILEVTLAGGETLTSLTGASTTCGAGDGYEVIRQVIQADAGAIVNVTSAVNTTGGNQLVEMDIFRFSPNITDSLVPRRSPQQIAADGTQLLSAAQNRMFCEARARVRDIDVQTRLKFTEICASIKDLDQDALYANALIKCFNLSIPLRKFGPSAMHPAVSVLIWLARTFGPSVAAAMLGVAQEKLKHWMEEGKKKGGDGKKKSTTSALVEDDDWINLLSFN